MVSRMATTTTSQQHHNNACERCTCTCSSQSGHVYHAGSMLARAYTRLLTQLVLLTLNFVV